MSNLITPQKMKEFGRDYVKILTRELLRAGKDASGQLIRSINYKIVEDAEIIRMVILAEKYLEFVDKGRKPGTYPPIEPLLRWARVKGLPQGVAYAAQKNIFKFGIKPTNVLRRAQLRIETFREYQARYERGVVDAIVKSIKKDVEAGNKGFVSISVS
jgi:hypothetical protein